MNTDELQALRTFINARIDEEFALRAEGDWTGRAEHEASEAAWQALLALAHETVKPPTKL